MSNAITFSGFESLSQIHARETLTEVKPTTPAPSACHCHACMCGDGFCIQIPRPSYTSKRARRRAR